MGIWTKLRSSHPKFWKDHSATQCLDLDSTGSTRKKLSKMIRWFLECYSREKGQIERVPLRQFPVTIGRGDDADITLNSTDVSRAHAELSLQNNRLWVRDLDSTNGTFVNHERISEPTRIQNDDVLHFAHVEARVIDEDNFTGDVSNITMMMNGDLSSNIPLGSRHLKCLLENAQVTPLYQPIVNPDGSHFGYELLGRGAHPELLPNPGALFHIAESIDKAVELSELFRNSGLDEAYTQELNKPLFVNTHPHEMHDQTRLLQCLADSREKYPNLHLVIEIHEQAVTDIKVMQHLAQEIKAMGCGLAYDDFGAGQARLLELTEAPPEVVKFDIALIRNIHRSTVQKQEMLEMLEMLVAMVQKMGIKALAEGVSCPEEAEVCQRIGFDLIQGFAFGFPYPLPEWRSHW
ncbi:EAL domain-containing protein [Hahella ganghwensis]|uniref:EAL domain-containing protein n=1 Tax=Hahella ganghwensis TaxID=286420 RepID=UPI0003A5797E|nr:EAL domain-containing protein [Hahella ganghwensis]